MHSRSLTTKAEIDVSVYNPKGNCSPLVQRAVRAVIKQTWRSKEIIVINNVLADYTCAVAEKMSDEDDRILGIHQPEASGAPVAHNVAFEIGRGHSTTNVDDDPASEETRFTQFLRAGHKLQDLGITPSCLYFQSRRPRKGQAPVSQRPKSVRLNDLFVQDDIGNQLFAPKEHYEASASFNPDMLAWQDLDLFIPMVKTFGRACLVNGATYLYDDDDRDDRTSGEGDRIRRMTKTHSDIYPNVGPLHTLQMVNGDHSIQPTSVRLRLIPSGRQLQSVTRGLQATPRHWLGLRKSFL